MKSSITTAQEGIAEARAETQANKDYNAHVELDKEKKEATEKEYGNLGRAHIAALFPADNPALPELQEMFARKGEQFAREGLTPAEVTSKLAEASTQYKNELATIRNLPGPERLFGKIGNTLLGKSRKPEDVRNTIKTAIAPLLQQGLNDTARAEISSLGYAPEEVESLITDLGEGSKKTLSQMPKISKSLLKEDNRSFAQKNIDYMNGNREYETPEYSPEQREQISNYMVDAFQNDPTANLILLRKAFEEKDVDWDTFKSILDENIHSGKIKLWPDQLKMTQKLDEPPLDNLGKILNKMNLLGK